MDVEHLPTLIGGRYRPIRKLGEGSMGFIFEVEHDRTGDRLALKLLRSQTSLGPGVVERFKREARASAKIRSDHVVRIIDADSAPEFGGALYLVMELLEGSDLEHVANGVPQAPIVVIEWLRQAAHAVDKAHSLGVVHRDLKPENLFLTRTERGQPLVKVLDFGIAKTMGDSPGTTQSGQLLGTPLFMAPEQARADEEVGPAADRYALGLIAFRLLTGMDYWEPTANVAGVVAQILYEPMPLPSAKGIDLGPGFDEWFMKACHRDPEQRFSSATELVQELGRALNVATSWSSLSNGYFTPPSLTPLLTPVSVPALPLAGASVAPTLSTATRDVGTEPRPPQSSRRLALAAVVFAVCTVLGLVLFSSGARTGSESPPGAAASGLSAAHAAAEQAIVASKNAAPVVIPVPSSRTAESSPDAHPRPRASAEGLSRNAAPERSLPAPPRATPRVTSPDRGGSVTEHARPASRPRPAVLDDPLSDQK